VIVDPAFGPGMRFRVGSAEDRAAVAELKRSKARIIFVALGAPIQELWMAAHQQELPGRVLIGVGQAFDVLAGRRRAAPLWATHLGLEWAFRLIQEPRRLGRRYLIDDPRFFWWMLRQRLQK
jgi:N-acetylglucosaminyldiphosphoundecaprenol N-acetyl-beta-D-mannosaminyltransferase